MVNRGPLYILVGYTIWGLLPIFWKQLEMVDSMYVLGSRIVWSVVLMALILTFQRKGRQVREAGRRELLPMALAGVFVCVNWGAYIWAVTHGRVLDASLAYYMNPIISILLAAVIFRERLTKLQWLAVGVTFAGVVVAVIRYRQMPWLALTMAVAFGIYGAFKKGVRAESSVSVFYEALVLLPLAVGYVGFMEFRGTGAVGVLYGWQWLLLPMAGVVTAVPLLLYAKGLKTTSLSLSGILMYVSPTIQLLLSVWLYGEEFTTTHAILFGFVWSGLALYLISGWRNGRKQRKGERVCG